MYINFTLMVLKLLATFIRRWSKSRVCDRSGCSLFTS